MSSQRDNIRVAVLQGQWLSWYGLKETFSEMFPHGTIHHISSSHLTPRILSLYDVLVLPGIAGEDSIYPEIFGQLRKETLHNAITKHGLALVTICAATYSLFDELHYLKRDGTRKHIQGLGFVSGRADGPAYAHITRTDFLRASAIDDIRLAHLHDSRSGNTYHAVEINGPQLHPTDPLAHIFLHHAGIPKTPAAAITKPYGKGLIIGFGSHIELPLNMAFFAQNQMDFAAHEESRRALLAEVKKMIAAHMKERTKDSLVQSGLLQLTTQ